MKSWFKNKWNKGKMLAELKPALFLSLTFCFMIFIYAPLEFYINNSNEFWYDAYLLFPFIFKDFLLFFVISLIGFTVAYFIAKIVYEIALYGYFACMIACYIQGNFMIKNLPPLDGTEINWTLYRTETMKSTIMWIAVAVICLIGFMIFRYPEHPFLLRIWLVRIINCWMVQHLMIALSIKRVISGSADIFSINILEKIIW